MLNENPAARLMLMTSIHYDYFLRTVVPATPEQLPLARVEGAEAEAENALDRAGAMLYYPGSDSEDSSDALEHSIREEDMWYTIGPADVDFGIVGVSDAEKLKCIRPLYLHTHRGACTLCIQYM